MAIQHRRGAFNLFDPTRLLPGEWAIVLSGDTSASDGRAAYICFAAGTVKRIATFEDMAEAIANATQDVIADLTSACNTATGNANTATTAANNAASTANTAATNANTKAGLADTAARGANQAKLETMQATEDCVAATGRANTAADEAEAFLAGFEVNYENLSDECIALITQAAGTGASVITDEQGIAIIDDMASMIITGRQTGTLSDEEGLEIINEIFF